MAEVDATGRYITTPDGVHRVNCTLMHTLVECMFLYQQRGCHYLFVYLRGFPRTEYYRQAEARYPAFFYVV